MGNAFFLMDTRKIYFTHIQFNLFSSKYIYTDTAANIVLEQNIRKTYFIDS